VTESRQHPEDRGYAGGSVGSGQLPWPRRFAAAVDWRGEGIAAALVAVFSTLAGGAVGEIWRGVATHVDLRGAAAGSEAATKALLDDDAQFAVIGAVTGLLLGLAVLWLWRRAGVGPGTALGLVAGGVLGSLVAAHVGAVGRSHTFTVSALRQMFPTAAPAGIAGFRSEVRFGVRTHVVLLAWPMVAAIVVAVRAALPEGRRTAAGAPGRDRDASRG
jgi:hypothetical protein